jgi:hypothetical protein
VERNQTQHLYNGFGQTLSRAFEMVGTPILFGLLGHLLDGWVGTRNVFMLLLGGFAIVGMSVRMYFGYVEAMKAHEADRPWARKG